jgi:hypothetical protein
MLWCNICKKYGYNSKICQQDSAEQIASGSVSIVSTTVKGCNSTGKGFSSFGRGFKGSSTIGRRFIVVDRNSNKGLIVFRCGKRDVGTFSSQHPTKHKLVSFIDLMKQFIFNNQYYFKYECLCC